MIEAIELHRSGVVEVAPLDDYVVRFAQAARSRNLAALTTALLQRYPGRLG